MGFWKRWMIFVLTVVFAVPDAVMAREKPMEIHSEAAILMDAKTGEVLFEKNSRQVMYPASITKIVTGIMAIESGRLKEWAETSKRARWAEGTRIYLAEGERKQLQDLVYGLLMHSGNDAAIVIAEHLSGSVEGFAEEMNRFKDRILGDDNQTHFTNPHGLFHEKHVTTPYDMARLARYAMQNPMFRKIVGTKKLPWKGKEWETTLVNHNKLLWRYEGATGVKNGYVFQSGNTLVSSAQRAGTEWIAVGMKAKGSEKVYEDAVHLFDYGFQHFETKRLLVKGQRIILENREWLANQDIFFASEKGQPINLKVAGDGDMVLKQGDRAKIWKGACTPVEEEASLRKPPVLSAGTVPKEAASQQPEEERDTASIWLSFLGIMIVFLYGWWRRNERRNQGQ